MDLERLSALDAAFLCLESRQAPLHLGALAIFGPQRDIAPDQLSALLGDRVQRVPSLHRRVRMTWLPPGAMRWVQDESFDLAHHLHQHTLDEHGDDALADLVVALMAVPLNQHRPLWQLHLITGLSRGRFALLVKVHHAMADGLRAVQLGIRLLDQCTDAPPTAAAPPNRTGFGPLSLLDIGRAVVGMAFHPDRTVAGLARYAASIPGAVAEALGTASIAASVVSHVRIGTLLAPGISSTAPSTNQRLALLKLDLDTVRQVGKRHGGTDNDILLTVMTGALREWLTGKGRRVGSRNVRALIPVSRRTHGPHCGNLLSGYLCDLPTREPNPLARLHKIRTMMNQHKAAGFTHGPGAFPILADRLPAAVHHLTAPLTRHCAPLLFDTIVTNVPIPTRPWTLAGAPLQEVYPIVPLAHGQALGIALFTYQGSIHVGLRADPQMVPDLPRLAAAVPTALATLTAASSTAL
ncbi:wax ester/triacylglycerol synthase family O-acyltransferase [Dactylosporangium sp. NPDC000521]|uniref:wax ester/triacylglycerol synthase family O-acyltransferase n=1 Tax=Dactylosporangium sp. NPDC000521 TaxID=3363975 RepID=UPI0036996684